MTRIGPGRRGRDLREGGDHRAIALRIVGEPHDIVGAAGGLLRQALEAPQDLLFHPERLGGDDAVQGLHQEIADFWPLRSCARRCLAQFEPTRDGGDAEHEEDDEGDQGEQAAAGREQREEDGHER